VVQVQVHTYRVKHGCTGGAVQHMTTCRLKSFFRFEWGVHIYKLQGERSSSSLELQELIQRGFLTF
jgi:hypothetical protein